MSHLRKILKSLLFLSALFFCIHTQAQLVVDGGVTAEEMAEILVGSGLNIENVELVCPQGASGSFEGTFTNLGINTGVMLTSGAITNAVGPNNDGGAGINNGGGTDADLAGLVPGFDIFDACYLKFDFTPQGDTLTFNYVFGSEEYEGFVCSSYNDVFGFFIEGGTEYPTPTNVALVPGTDVQVSINTVNIGVADGINADCILTNSEYYVDNGNGQNPDPNSTIQYDGFTTVLTAQAVVTPCQPYTLKLAVSDAGDGILDSGVFIAGGSLSTNFIEITASTIATTAVGVENPVEGCVDAVISFIRSEGSTNGDLEVAFEIGGTAENGGDYESIPTSITIPDGSTSYDLLINTIYDDLDEGQESVTISLINQVSCDSTNVQLVEVLIDEQIPMVVSSDITINEGESAPLSVTGGGDSYGWYPFLSLDDASSAEPIATPTETTTYTVTSFFGDCFFQEEVTVFVLGCEADAGEVTGPEPSTICQFETTGAASVEGANPEFDYTFVVTGPDDAETIVSYSDDGSFSASGLALGDYCVYGMNYASEGEEELDLNVGTISELTGQVDACIALSDCYTITIEACCISDAGTATAAPDFVCAGSTVQGTAADFTLDDDDILGYALHNSPDGDAGMEGFELYALSADGSFINDGSAASNTEIYVSSVVANDDGAGLPDLTDPCLSISPGAPVVFLDPITFEENEECDWTLGEYTLTMAVYGGLPAYDSNESYTIQGFYGGQLLADQTFTIVLPSTDGMVLNFSATDLLSCSGSWSKEIICFKNPIELLSFAGQVRAEDNLLTWTTSSETDISGFVLESSRNGVDFDHVSEIQGAGFNTNTSRDYQYLDEKVSGSLYYRLSSRALSGNIELGPVVLIERHNEATGATVLPIPATDKIQLTASYAQGMPVEISIVDITGKQLRAMNQMATQGLNQWKFGLDDLPSGVYFLLLNDQKSMQTIRFIKQ